MTPNIGKSYVIEKHFLLQVWIWNRYLKIRLYLAWILVQSSDCTKKKCQWFGHFHRQPRVPSWKWSYAEHDDTKDACKKWSLTGFGNAVKNRACNVPYTRRHADDWAITELAPRVLASSGSGWLPMAISRRSVVSLKEGKEEEEEEGNAGKERGGKKKQKRKKGGVPCVQLGLGFFSNFSKLYFYLNFSQIFEIVQN